MTSGKTSLHRSSTRGFYVTRWYMHNGMGRVCYFWIGSCLVFTQICSKLTPCSSVSIVNFEHVIAGWSGIHIYIL